MMELMQLVYKLYSNHCSDKFIGISPILKKHKDKT